MPEERSRSASADKEIQLVVLVLSGEEFGLDISQVREIIRMQEIALMPQAPDFIEGVINLRGQIIGVVNLSRRLGLKSRPRTDRSRIIVLEVKENTVGLIVDEVPEVLRIRESQIGPTPHLVSSHIHSDLIQGVGKLDDRLIILLEAGKILSPEEARGMVETSAT